MINDGCCPHYFRLKKRSVGTVLTRCSYLVFRVSDFEGRIHPDGPKFAICSIKDTSDSALNRLSGHRFQPT
jgi:hypothetical protein